MPGLAQVKPGRIKKHDHWVSAKGATAVSPQCAGSERKLFYVLCATTIFCPYTDMWSVWLSLCMRSFKTSTTFTMDHELADTAA